MIEKIWINSNKFEIYNVTGRLSYQKYCFTFKPDNPLIITWGYNPNKNKYIRYSYDFLMSSEINVPLARTLITNDNSDDEYLVRTYVNNEIYAAMTGDAPDSKMTYNDIDQCFLYKMCAIKGWIRDRVTEVSC